MEVVMTTSLWSLTGGNRKVVLSECYYLYCYGCWWIVVDIRFVEHFAMGHYHICILVLLIVWPVVSCLLLTDIPYSGKLSREKTFINFTVWWLFTKVFLWNLGVWHLWHCKSKQSTKVFSVKIVVFTNSRKFSKSKVFRYTVLWWIVDTLMYKCMYVMLLTIGLIFMPPLGDPSFCWGWS